VTTSTDNLKIFKYIKSNHSLVQFNVYPEQGRLAVPSTVKIRQKPLRYPLQQAGVYIEAGEVMFCPFCQISIPVWAEKAGLLIFTFGIPSAV